MAQKSSSGGPLLVRDGTPLWRRHYMYLSRDNLELNDGTTRPEDTGNKSEYIFGTGHEQ